VRRRAARYHRLRITRNVFTTGTKATDDDPDIPGWAEDYAETRPDFQVVDRGEPIAEEDIPDPNQSTIEDAVDRAEPVSVQASDKPGRDVEAVPEDTDTDDDPKGSTDEVPLSDVDYNILKAKAARIDDVDVGQPPSKQDLIDALQDAGIDGATVGGSDE